MDRPDKRTGVSSLTQTPLFLCAVRYGGAELIELVDSVQTVDIMVEDVLCRQFLLEAFNYQVTSGHNAFSSYVLAL